MRLSERKVVSFRLSENELKRNNKGIVSIGHHHHHRKHHGKISERGGDTTRRRKVSANETEMSRGSPNRGYESGKAA